MPLRWGSAGAQWGSAAREGVKRPSRGLPAARTGCRGAGLGQLREFRSSPVSLRRAVPPALRLAPGELSFYDRAGDGKKLRSTDSSLVRCLGRVWAVQELSREELLAAGYEKPDPLTPSLSS